MTIFAVGTAIILFNVVIPSGLGLSMELSVGIMLIVLGGWNLWDFLCAASLAPTSSIRLPILAFHPHTHGDYFHHTHSHWDSPESHAHTLQQTPIWRLDSRLGKVGMYQFLRSLIVGMVHGLAGSVAVALLILASIRNSVLGIAYLLIFGLGTTAGMMLITVSIASLEYAGSRFRRFNRNVGMASGLISVWRLACS